MPPKPKRKAPAKKAALKKGAPPVQRGAAQTSVPMYFGRAMKAARVAAGLSQAELSKIVGIAQPDLPAIERGDRDVRITTASRIARALGIPVRSLLPPD
jgi:DNA-binding XRE family transcriptional regulator